MDRKQFIEELSSDFVADKIYEIWPELDYNFSRKVSSTSEVIKERFERGELDAPALLVAGEQTAGRGRKNRSWFSPPAGGMYISFLLSPAVPSNRITLYTVVSGLAVQKCLENFSYPVRLRWPNDIYLDGRKVAGILSEYINLPERQERVSAGIGINVCVDNFPKELEGKATSLHKYDCKIPSASALLFSLIEEMGAYNQRLKDGCGDQLLEYWKDRLDIIDSKVKINSGRKCRRGTVRDITSRGELVVEMEDELRKVRAGDVKREYCRRRERKDA